MADLDLAALGAVSTVTINGRSPEPPGIRDLAESLMHQHGLNGWTLVFDQASTRAGECRFCEREISLSAPLMSLWTRAQCEDTIKHEIAHALTPTDRGHGIAWQRMCLVIGADPSRTWGHNGEQRIPGKYLGTCPAGHTITKHRRPKTENFGSCRECSPRYDPRYRFTWTER
jgi:predicted SprT family Zn-dependent metalloprotease